MVSHDKDVQVLIQVGGAGQTLAQGTATTPQTTATTADKAAPPSNSAVVTRRQVKSLAVAAMVGKQAYSYSTSNIGKWTGSSRNQRTYNNVAQAVGLGILTYVNPVLAGVTMAVQIGTTAIDYNYERTQERRRSRQALARAGYSSQGEILGKKR